MPTYQLQRGTYDAYDDDALNLDKLQEILKATVSLYGFNPIITPIYEQTELFTRSVGESSDIVNKEMFSFVDKGGRNISLRPELTAGVMRAVVTNKLYATRDLPLKYYYCGPAFRYERPQQGRYRQFTQFGVERVGVTSPLDDAETIIMGYSALLMIGFPRVTLKINTLGDEKTRDNYRAALKEYFAPHIASMCEDCKRRFETNPLRILDCKDPQDREIIAKAPSLSDYLSDEEKAYFKMITDALKRFDIPYELDTTLVRGLDYYSHVVFEYHYTSDDGTNLGAIGAGGHYDNLVSEVGGPMLSSVGFALGLERLNSLLKEIKPEEYEKPFLDCFLIYQGEECQTVAFDLAMMLRFNGFKCDLLYQNKNYGAQLKVATRKMASFAIFVGEDEVKNHRFNIKNLETQEQEAVAYDDLVAYLDEHLEVHHHD